MSIEAINHIMKTAITDGVAKLVAFVLADYADPATWECWPKVDSLAARCSQSPRTVQRKLQLLEELGIIAIEEQFRGKRQIENRYWIRQTGASRPPSGGRGDRINENDGSAAMGDTQSPIGKEAPEGCHRVTGEGDNAVTPGVTLLSPLENPPLESTKREDSPQPPDAGGRGRPKVFRGNGIPEPVRPVERRRDVQPALDPATAEKFERLWSTFPEGGIVYADRVAAERIFAELPADDQDLAVAAVRGYRAQLERDGSKAKALHRWLKIRRFANVRTTTIASMTIRVPGRVFVKAETPAWEAWAAYERAAGRVPKSPSWSDSERAEGWWFPTMLPPAHSSAA